MSEETLEPQEVSSFQPMGAPPTKTKAYIGCKIIRAEPMSQEDFLRSRGKWQDGQETYGDGYKVIYADNYVSWSPKKVFEEAYREVTQQETYLVMRNFD